MCAACGFPGRVFVLPGDEDCLGVVVVTASASRGVGREFEPRPGHTKDLKKKWYWLLPHLALSI